MLHRADNFIDNNFKRKNFIKKLKLNILFKQNSILTTRSSAQNEAIAPPIECPVTMMGILPYASLVFLMPLTTPSRNVVLWYAE